MKHLIPVLFFIFLSSCKETEVSPLAKFTGAFKYQSRHFVFTEKSNALHVSIDGIDYGIASVYGEAFAILSGGLALTVDLKDGAFNLVMIEGNALTKGVLTRE